MCLSYTIFLLSLSWASFVIIDSGKDRLFFSLFGFSGLIESLYSLFHFDNSSINICFSIFVEQLLRFKKKVTDAHVACFCETAALLCLFLLSAMACFVGPAGALLENLQKT